MAYMHRYISLSVCLAMFVCMKKIGNSFYHKAVAHSCAHLSSEKKSKFAEVLPLDQTILEIETRWT